MHPLISIVLLWPMIQMAQRRGLSAVVLGVWLQVCLLAGGMAGAMVGTKTLGTDTSHRQMALVVGYAWAGTVAGAVVAFGIARLLPPVGGVWREPARIQFGAMRAAVATCWPRRRLTRAALVFFALLFCAAGYFGLAPAPMDGWQELDRLRVIRPGMKQADVAALLPGPVTPVAGQPGVLRYTRIPFPLKTPGLMVACGVDYVFDQDGVLTEMQNWDFVRAETAVERVKRFIQTRR